MRIRGKWLKDRYRKSIRSCAGETYEQVVSYCLYGILDEDQRSEMMDQNNGVQTLQSEVLVAVETHKAFSQNVVDRLGNIKL